MAKPRKPQRLDPNNTADLEAALKAGEVALAHEAHQRISPTRRGFLKGAAAAGATLIAAGVAGKKAAAAGDHGVASGNPQPDSVILWTRVPDAFQTGPLNLPVGWEVSTTEAFLPGTVVSSGTTTTNADKDFTVRVQASGLQPFTRYHYRFFTESGYTSVTGRTLTAPHINAMPDEVRFAFVSCSNHNGRQWNVYDALATDDVHYCAHLGDNVYEGSLGYTAKTLDDFRKLHRLYLDLPQLREVRRLFPWVHTWDDHETFNNYHGGDMTADQRAVQAAAYKAFSEYMPLDLDIEPVETNGVTELKIYRQLTFGRLFDFFVTDGRQYRGGEICGREILVGPCDDLYDPDRTMLGRAQTDWLKAGLASSEARWKFVLNGTVMMAMKLTNPLIPIFKRTKGDTLRETSEGLVINLDQWDGFPENRKELLAWVEDQRISNLVVLTGDIHNCFAGQLKSDFGRERTGPVAGVELVTGSVTSSGIAEAVAGYDLTDLVYKAFQPANPHIDYVDAYYHVYTRVTVRPAEIKATYVAVDTVTSADFEAFELNTLTVKDGVPEITVE